MGDRSRTSSKNKRQSAVQKQKGAATIPSSSSGNIKQIINDVTNLYKCFCKSQLFALKLSPLRSTISESFPNGQGVRLEIDDALADVYERILIEGKQRLDKEEHFVSSALTHLDQYLQSSSSAPSSIPLPPPLPQKMNKKRKETEDHLLGEMQQTKKRRGGKEGVNSSSSSIPIPPPVTSSTPSAPSHIAQLVVGSQVAALLSLQSSDWILCKVIRYLPDKGRYEIEDEDPGDEEEGYLHNGTPLKVTNKHYKIARERLIPLEEWDSENPHTEHKKGTQVLAVFPDTTTFYPAIVVAPPSSRSKHRDYLLKFVDDEENTRRILPRFVVAAPTPMS